MAATSREIVAITGLPKMEDSATETGSPLRVIPAVTPSEKGSAKLDEKKHLYHLLALLTQMRG